MVALNGVLKAMALGVAWAQAINLFITFMEEPRMGRAVETGRAEAECHRHENTTLMCTTVQTLPCEGG